MSGLGREKPANGGGGEPLGVLLRAYADGELSGEQREEVERHLERTPDDRPRVQLERDLRAACARVMGGEGSGLPEGVRDRVLRAVAESRAEETRVGASVGNSEPVRAGRGVDEGEGPGVLARIGRWQGYLATAAVLVLAGLIVVVLVRQAGGPGEQAGSVIIGSAEATAGRVALASFLETQHSRCTTDEGVYERKMRLQDPAELPGVFASLSGGSPSIERILEAGFVFKGAGQCRVPGDGESYHLLFGPPEGRRFPSHLSLFVQRDTGELDIEEGETYRLDVEGGKRMLAVVWKREGVVYYLVAECSPTRSRACEALGVVATPRRAM